MPRLRSEDVVEDEPCRRLNLAFSHVLPALSLVMPAIVQFFSDTIDYLSQ